MDIRSEILKRDNNMCVLSFKKNLLEVHHIDYKSSGVNSHYNNLVTLHRYRHKGDNDSVHDNKWKYYFRLKLYTWQFEEPSYWDDVVNAHQEKINNIRIKLRSVNKEKYKKSKQQFEENFLKNNNITYKEHCRKIRKKYRENFKKSRNG
jgi:hypothetical protein